MIPHSTAYIWLSELLISQDVFTRKMVNITNEKNRIISYLKEELITKSLRTQLTKIKNSKEDKDFF